MLASITPLGERGRGRRWATTATAYVVGSLAGGAALGALLGLAGAMVPAALRPQPVVLALAAALCALGVASDVRLGGLRLPSLHRQVDEDWLTRYRGWVYGVAYGAQLGVGVVTIVTSASVYVTFALAFLSGSVATGCALGAVFGLVRALPVPAMRGVRTAERLRALHRSLERWAPAAARSAVVAQGAAAAVLVLGVA